MKLIILIAAASFPPFNRSENKGDVIECEDELANDLIEAGLAEPFNDPSEPVKPIKKEPSAPVEEPTDPKTQETEAVTAKKNK